MTTNDHHDDNDADANERTTLLRKNRAGSQAGNGDSGDVEANYTNAHGRRQARSSGSASSRSSSFCSNTGRKRNGIIKKASATAVGKVKETPLPWKQFSLVILLQFCEPLCAQVIYPFVPQMIRDLGVTGGDEARVAHYVGILESIFFASEALLVLHWSRASDSIGRKPVVLIGLFGLALSMFLFGLSKSFAAAVIARVLNGALNGNTGVIKSLIAELSDETNIARAFAWAPVTWSVGSTVGPFIGGVLSNPAQQYPSLFGQNDFLKTYPYFLPCATAGAFCVVVWVVCFLLMNETNPTSFSLRRYLPFTSNSKWHSKEASSPDSDASSTTLNDQREGSQTESVPLKAALIPRTLLAATNYALLALVDITLRAILPVFYSTPYNLGGLALSPSVIGSLLAGIGIINGLFQLFFLADLIRAIGNRNVYLMGILSAGGMIILFPFMNLLVVQYGGMTPFVWILLGLQQVLSIPMNNSFGSIHIYVTSSASSRRTLGATNGFAQALVSTMRAIGPAIANSLLSISLRLQFPKADLPEGIPGHGDTGGDDGGSGGGNGEMGLGRWAGGFMVYAVLTLAVCVAVYAGSKLPREAWRREESESETSSVGTRGPAELGRGNEGGC